MKIILNNVNRAYAGNKVEACHILIEDGKISRISSEAINEEADRVIDGESKLVTAVFIAVHMHLREPGGEHIDTIKTGTVVAARSGYTTVCLMRNISPVLDKKKDVVNLFVRSQKDVVVRVLP